MLICDGGSWLARECLGKKKNTHTHAVTIRNASTFYTLPTHFRDEDIVLLQGAATAGLT
jgi:hypothetical protein